MRSGAYSLPLAVFGAVPAFIRVRSPQDYYGGVALVALALFALWASSDLPGMRGFAFGPGTAPRLFAYCLLGLGVAVALIGLLTDGPPSEPFSFCGPFGGAVLLVVLIPMTIYAARIGKSLPGMRAGHRAGGAGGAGADRPRAHADALRAARAGVHHRRDADLRRHDPPARAGDRELRVAHVSATATHEVRWIETLIWAVVLAVFCSLLFPYGLNLPLQLWPRF